MGQGNFAPSAMIIELVITASVVVFTLACMVIDVRSRRIPNWLTVPSFALGVIVHTASGGWSGLQTSLAGFATGFIILFVLWLCGGGGGGDVKMLGALGAWLGATMVVFAFLASAVVTVFIVLGTILSEAFFRGKTRKASPAGGSARRGDGSRNSLKSASRPGHVVPYAVPLAIGTWVVLALSWWRFGGLFEGGLY